MVNSYLDENAGSTSANTQVVQRLCRTVRQQADADEFCKNSTSADANTSSDTEGDSSDSGTARNIQRTTAVRMILKYDDSEDAYSEEY